MKHSQTSSQPKPGIFEINLIGHRVDRLRRRRTWSRFGDVAAIIMVALALLCCIVTAHHLFTIMRTKSGLRKLRAELTEEQKTADELDRIRDQVIGSIGKLKLFVPVAKRRIRWAPKLSALARALPSGMGVAKISVRGDDFFADPNNPKQRRRVGKFGMNNIDEAHLFFSLVYLPTASKTRDPMGDLRDNLIASDAFMDKMILVRIERQLAEIRNGACVQSFEGLLKAVQEGQRQ